MGTWDTKSFGNDAALDWVYALEESKGPKLIKLSIQNVTERGNNYLEADICCCAIAAAETVAALKGKPCKELPDEVQHWVKKNPLNDINELSKSAVDALKIITTSSELNELWEESGEYKDWKKNVSDLVKRLS